MIPAQDFDIVGSYNNQQVSPIDSERTVNMFEYRDPRAKKPKVLINTSGLINTNYDFGNVVGGFRAEYTFNFVHYIVISNKVFSINLSGILATIGTLTNTTIGYVGVTANTFQVTFVDGVNGYVWDTNALTFTQITDTSFPASPIDCDYLDGFTIVANGGTNQFQLSSFNQSLVWGPASDTFTASSVTSKLTIGNTANYQTGVTVQLTTTGSLPTGLSTGVTYFVINTGPTTLQLATTYTNAINGVFIVLTSNGAPVNTITSLGQLQLGAITSHPGTIVACRTLHRRLFLFSQFFTEVWENAGLGTNLPFRRSNSLLIEFGTPAIGSIVVGFDRMFFLSQSQDSLGPVAEIRGSEAVPVSNRALDAQLANYAALGQIADCTGFLVRENGLIFYRMNFTKANHTYVYNATLSNFTEDLEKLWHEEEVLNGDRHPAQTHAYFNGINYVGDYEDPILYKLDDMTFTNDGENIRRMRITRPIAPPGSQRIRIDRMQVDLLQGNNQLQMPMFEEIDLLTESMEPILTESLENIILNQQTPIFTTNITPRFVFLSLSKDGGQTFGYVTKAPMGNVGQRAFRTLWRKLGVVPRGQAVVLKIEFFDMLPFIILGASWVFEILPE